MAGETEVLEGLGLTPNEAKLYFVLLRSGRLKANELAVKSGLQRRTVYDTLQQLEKKGLAGKIEVRGVTCFVPSPPSSLLSLLEEKRSAIEKILPQLSGPYEQGEKTGVSVIYGVSGMKMVLEDILALKADYCVYYGQLQIFDYLPKFVRIFHEKKRKLGIRSRYMLLDVPQARERSKLIPLAGFKFIDPSALSGGVWWTYADRLVLYILQKEEPITIFIKNAELARTFRKTFDEMFESKTAVYRGWEGMKAIFEQTLKHKETLFIGGSGQAPQNYPDYFEKEYNPRAEKLGHAWKNVAHRSILKTPAMGQKFHQIRLLPEYFEFNPNVVWIFGDCVANVVWLPEPVAFLVEDRHVAGAYRNYFKVLWKMAKPAK